MKHAHTLKRAMAVMLALVLTLSLVTPTWAMSSSSVATKGENNGITWEKVDNIKLPIKENAAVEEEAQQQYADTDVVRVSIVLSDPSTLDKGFSASDIASGSKKAMKYRDKLESKQDKMAKTISKKALDGQSLDVVWNLTLATNIISANVQYGQIEKIEQIKGVDSVLIETQYEPCVVKESETTDPNMATSSSMIGSSVAWADGYTGAGSKVAIIDTGADTDHPSLNGAAYSYAVKGLGITPVTAADYADKLEKLNALKKNGDLKASDLYVSAKIPFGFNYIDADLDVTHDNDKQGDHGSHVTGIAAGNRYIEQADGSFAPALDTALTQGVAPDAQVYTMKVFGKGGGAYDSDYMAAIEDAMILGCDSATCLWAAATPAIPASLTPSTRPSWRLLSTAVWSLPCPPVTPATGSRTPPMPIPTPRASAGPPTAAPAPTPTLWASPPWITWAPPATILSSPAPRCSTTTPPRLPSSP